MIDGRTDGYMDRVNNMPITTLSKLMHGNKGKSAYTFHINKGISLASLTTCNPLATCR